MNRQALIGIAGGTGSGKTTLAHRIENGLGERCCVLEHDWYYHDFSHFDPCDREEVNYDHPESLDNELLLDQLAKLQ
ncbi:MAG: uridine kinase, partial [Bradymonadaceae bacterium]